MAASTPSRVYVDLINDFDNDSDSLSELSDSPIAASKSAPSSSKKSPSKASLPKSASSASLPLKAKPKAASNSAPKPNAGDKTPTTKSKKVTKNGEAIVAQANGSNGAKKPSSKTKPIEMKSKANKTAVPVANGATGSPNRITSLVVDPVIKSRTHVNGEDQEAKLCHHHRQACKGALLECTFMRAPGKRCKGRYCFSCLKRLYDQDPETIVKSGRMMINPEEHCPPSEAKYAWKCPKCRGKCNCAVCRKAAGLLPLGKWAGGNTGKNSAPSIDGPNASEPPASATANATSATSSTSLVSTPTISTKSKKVGHGAKDTSKAKSVKIRSNGGGFPPPKSKKAKGRVKADGEEDDSIRTPPPPSTASVLAQFKKVSSKKTVNSVLVAVSKPKAPVFKPLKAPVEVAPPTLEVISTKLPEENMRARMWIYESFIRFDKIGLGRSVLTQLDKFDVWTHSMMQEMLACLLKTIAGLSHIDKGQPTKPFFDSINAYRKHGKDLRRGEPWSAASAMLRPLGFPVSDLPFVDHDVPVEVEVAAAYRSPSPSPLANRVTRARRAKENKHYEIAKQLSMLDDWEADEFGTASEQEDEAPRKRRRTAAQRSIYLYDDSDSEADDHESMDETQNGRRASRRVKPTARSPTPEARLTGRQQALKIQQEHQKEQIRQQRLEEEEAARAAAEEEEKSQRHRAQENENSFANGSADVSMQDEEKEKGDEAMAGSAEGHMEEIPSPDFETKVAIISALIDAALMAEPISEELKLAADNIMALEREHKAQSAEMESEIAAELGDLNKQAPSIVAPEYQAWKMQKASLEEDIAWRRLSLGVQNDLRIDTHALRTGPMGYDADGREYWHLREYQERMPKFTQGRYAWCVVILGKSFPEDPNGPKLEENSTKTLKDEIMEAVQEGDDSGLTSLSDSEEEGGDGDQDVNGGDVKKVDRLLPDKTNGEGHSKTNGARSQAEDRHNDVEGGPEKQESGEGGEGKVCMGVNDPAVIQTLIKYIEYRMERLEYEENQAMQDREKVFRLGNDGGVADAVSEGGQNGDRSDDNPAATAASGPDGSGGETMYAIRKAKQQLKDKQEERKKQVVQLQKRLVKSKEYFAWHRSELPPM